MYIQEITANLKEILTGDPWYGSNLISLLDGISQSNPNSMFNNSNSLGQILEHMIQWKLYAIEKVKGNIAFNIELNSQEDWQKGKVYNHKDFLALIDEFKKISLQLIELIQNKSDSFLSEQVPGSKYTYERMILGVIHHDLYHAGQISLLKRG